MHCTMEGDIPDLLLVPVACWKHVQLQAVAAGLFIAWAKCTNELQLGLASGT